MNEIELPEHLDQDLSRLSQELSGFEGRDDLALFILEAFVEEVNTGHEGSTNDISDEGVEDRLRSLGYVE